MSRQATLIFEIKGNALDDGPGIRSVVFFKGCPLSCAWCHNPEGQNRQAEIIFDGEKCIGCDSCIEVCKQQALSRNLIGFLDRGKCDLCGDCLEQCPSGALAKCGMSLSVNEVCSRVEKDIPFYTASGGGVTLSGGEPAMYPEFAGEVAAKLRQRHVHVLLETAGFFDSAAFDRFLYPHLDAIYFDIKIMDPARHKELCGVDNKRILENFRNLFRRSKEGGVCVLPRVPLIPGMTATQENLEDIANLLKEVGADQVALLPYHPFWMGKLARLGRSGLPAMGGENLARLMTPDELAECRSPFGNMRIVGT